MPSTPGQLSRRVEGPPSADAALWPPLPCSPCIPILLTLAALAAFFILTTAVLAERLFRRTLHPSSGPGPRTPTLVWRPGGELWIQPAGTARERSEDWYGCEVPLLTPGPPESLPPTGTLAAPASAPPAERYAPSASAPLGSPELPAQSSFWGPQPRAEWPPDAGLVSWDGPEPRTEAPARLGSPGAWRPRPGSPEPEWGLQPRVTLEQISAFWRREGRASVGL